MRLSELAALIKIGAISGDLETEVSGLANDSRQVKPGDLYFAIRGAKHDGHAFLPQAMAAGAIGAVVEEMPAEPGDRTYLVVPRVQEAIPVLAAKFYDYPAAKLRLIGVTGTNGKTTSTYLIRSILDGAGLPTGLIGTIQNLTGRRVLPAVNTTPGPLELQALLAEMVKDGCLNVVMEVSSHAIAMGRCQGCTFAAGLFTNITQDHLDFHGDFASYLEVKRRFFAALPACSWAVINVDDPNAPAFLEAAASAKKLTYGLGPKAQIRAENIQVSLAGVAYRAITPAGETDLRLNLTGHFNLYNSLGSLGAGLALGLELPVIARGLQEVRGVPGRFQSVPGGDRFGVIVDYAHTPDGLDNVLRTARELTPGRLIVVFGCGGDRDRTKRPLMGKVAAEYADAIFVTSDNPRSENPVSIIKQIEAGLAAAGKKPGQYRLITDREQAIRAAIALASPNDLVLIAGKGHETYQIFADRTIHFDDREAAATALEDKRNGILAD